MKKNTYKKLIKLYTARQRNSNPTKDHHPMKSSTTVPGSCPHCSPVLKVEPSKRLVFGWASTLTDHNGKQVIDKQEDMIDAKTMEQAIYRYVRDSRQGGYMHEKIGVGRLVESVFLDAEKREAMDLPPGKVGWWVGFYIDDDETWQKVLDGELKEFSIGGMADEKEIN